MAELLPILVACEYSDTVAPAFRAFGFDAYSCDLRPTEGDPRWHMAASRFAVEASGRGGSVVARINQLR
jgi:hypothetical protein